MNRLRELRESNDLTLKELGKELDMNASVLGNYERGDRQPKIEIWEKLALFFNVSTPYILGLTNKINDNVPKVELFDDGLIRLNNTVIKLTQFKKNQESLDDIPIIQSVQKSVSNFITLLEENVRDEVNLKSLEHLSDHLVTLLTEQGIVENIMRDKTINQQIKAYSESKRTVDKLIDDVFLSEEPFARANK